MLTEESGNNSDLSAKTVNGVFGRKLRELRRHRELSQQELAKRLGISRVTIANMESGRQNVQLHQIFSLADALDAPVERLFPSAVEIESNLYPMAQVRSDLLASSDVLFLRWAKNQLSLVAE